ncbi:MAG: type IV toxin-antitoxin system AbiEi family antitoxin [Actinobacteria bacterium]|nr:type IV toxin-antitoxin system AbiEi family antitoxin [Actinomycetota bacterium]
MNNTEKNIITKAVTRFEEETGLKLTTYITDEKVELVLREKEYDLKFTVEVVPAVNKTKLGIIKNRLKGLESIPLLVTQIATNDITELLKNLDINFIDAAGNAYINVPPLYINIKGQKLTRLVETKRTVNNITVKDIGIFQPAGLQIIFALLCIPKLERNPYREVAEMANVALGTVHTTMKLLEKHGFLINDETQSKKLTNKKELLKEWILGYPEKIKSKYLVGKYKTENPEFVRTTDFKYFGALLGGETAAAQITNYLRPLIHTIYIGDKIGEFVLRNRLKKNLNGNVEIVKKFWDFTNDNEIKNIVPAILVYTDLITTGDPRNIETANIIYERELAGYLN